MGRRLRAWWDSLLLGALFVTATVWVWVQIIKEALQ